MGKFQGTADGNGADQLFLLESKEERDD